MRLKDNKDLAETVKNDEKQIPNVENKIEETKIAKSKSKWFEMCSRAQKCMQGAQK